MYHIFVIDDDQRIRELLAQYLSEKEYVISSASNAKEALDLFNYWIPDLLIVDVMMPGDSGIILTKKVRKFSHVPILILTARDAGHDRIEGLEVGADDYVTKPFEPKELLLRVERILARAHHGGWKSKPQRMHFGGYVFDPSLKKLFKHDKEVSLSYGEIRILESLLSSKGEAVSRETLATLLGGIEERSVDVHMIRLRQKLEADPKRPRYLQTVRGQGYSLQVTV